MQKNRTLIVGPLPPPIGGTRVSFEIMISRLKEEMDFDLLILRYSSNRLINIFLQIWTFFKLILGAFFYDRIFLHANNKRILEWGRFLLLISKLKPLKLQFRFWGSSLDLYCEENLIRRNRLIGLIKSSQILVETRGLVDYCKNISEFSQNVHWFPNSRKIDLSTVKDENFDGFHFIYVGHITEAKGVSVLINAIERLLKKGTDSFIVDFVGRCEDKTLEDKIRSTSNSNFIGEITPNEVLQCFHSKSVFVFPSHYYGEGYPGAMLEAMSKGVPIICSAWRFLGELVEPGFNGLLHEPNNPQDLASCMEQFMKNPELISVMGKNSLKRVKEYDSEFWNGEGYKLITQELF